MNGRHVECNEGGAVLSEELLRRFVVLADEMVEAAPLPLCNVLVDLIRRVLSHVVFATSYTPVRKSPYSRD